MRRSGVRPAPSVGVDDSSTYLLGSVNAPLLDLGSPGFDGLAYLFSSYTVAADSHSDRYSASVTPS
jgi:hypothetical protein